MTLRIPFAAMTPVERSMGRFMRAPDHSAFSGSDDDDGLDSDDDDAQDDDQSGQSDDDDAGDGDEHREDDDDGSDPSDDDKPERGRNGYERRIAKLTARAKRAEAEAARLRGGGAKRDDADDGGKPKADPNAKPKVADFDNYEDFIEALADWKADQRISASKQQSQKEAAEADFNKRFTQGRKRFSDWDDVVTDDVEISTSALAAIKEADDPAGVVYYLGQNPDEADKLNELSPGKQALFIGKIEAKLPSSGKSSTGSREQRRTSSAPEPITPTRQNGGSVKKPYEKMTMAEFIAARNREIAQQRGR